MKNKARISKNKRKSLKRATKKATKTQKKTSKYKNKKSRKNKRGGDVASVAVPIAAAAIVAGLAYASQTNNTKPPKTKNNTQHVTYLNRSSNSPVVSSNEQSNKEEKMLTNEHTRKIMKIMEIYDKIKNNKYHDKDVKELYDLYNCCAYEKWFPLQGNIELAGVEETKGEEKDNNIIVRAIEKKVLVPKKET